MPTDDELPINYTQGDEHSIVEYLRKKMDIPESASFVEAVTRKWIQDGVSPDQRNADLVRLDRAQKGDEGFRRETGLANVRNRLQTTHGKLKGIGR